jgi:pyruvyltransferase
MVNKELYTVVHNDETVETSLMAIGSYLQTATEGTFVYGSGVRTDPPIESGHSYRSLRVSAVRGPLTRAFLEAKGIACPSVYGDPALLLPCFYIPVQQESLRDKIGLIPHFTQYDVYKRRSLPSTVHLISPTAPWRSVLNELCSCKSVVSSSLHGLICADAYGIPNVWLHEVPISEGDFKFRDYFASQGRSVQSIPSLEAYDESTLYAGGNAVDLDALRRAFPF